MATPCETSATSSGTRCTCGENDASKVQFRRGSLPGKFHSLCKHPACTHSEAGYIHSEVGIEP